MSSPPDSVVVTAHNAIASLVQHAATVHREHASEVHALRAMLAHKETALESETKARRSLQDDLDEARAKLAAQEVETKTALEALDQVLAQVAGVEDASKRKVGPARCSSSADELPSPRQ